MVALAAGPTRVSIIGSVFVGVLLSLVFVLVTSVRADSRSLDSLTTLWQVQASLAGIALPLLGVVVQIAGDQGQVAARTNEVLTRYSWLFPIAVFALFGAAVIGATEIWRFGPISVGLDYAWFAVTVVLAIFAYYRSLSCLFDPFLLRHQATMLARERMRASTEISAARRAANSLLIADTRAVGGEYMPYVPQQRQSSWLVVESDPNQTVVDVHLARLSQVLRDLTPVGTAAPVQSGVSWTRPSPPTPSYPIRLTRLIGQKTRLLDRSLVAVDRSLFGPFDERAFSSQVQAAFKTEGET